MASQTRHLNAYGARDQTEGSNNNSFTENLSMPVPLGDVRISMVWINARNVRLSGKQLPCASVNDFHRMRRHMKSTT